MCNTYGEVCFSKENVYKRFKHEFKSKRQFMDWKHTDSLLKKIFRAQWSLKMFHLTDFWDMKEPITTDFLEKDTTVNSVSYSQTIRQNSPYLLNNLHNATPL